MYSSTVDDVARHRVLQMRQDAERQRRAYRLTAVNRWAQRADRAARRAQLSRDALL